MKSFTTVECVEDLALWQGGLAEPLQAQADQLTHSSCHLALHDAVGVLVARCSLYERYDLTGGPVLDGLVCNNVAANADAGKNSCLCIKETWGPRGCGT